MPYSEHTAAVAAAPFHCYLRMMSFCQTVSSPFFSQSEMVTSINYRTKQLKGSLFID
jgi:hypothetical protein